MILIDNLEGFIDKSAEKLSEIKIGKNEKKEIVQKMEMARVIADSIVKSELMPCDKRHHEEKFVRGKGGNSFLYHISENTLNFLIKKRGTIANSLLQSMKI